MRKTHSAWQRHLWQTVAALVLVGVVAGGQAALPAGKASGANENDAFLPIVITALDPLDYFLGLNGNAIDGGAGLEPSAGSLAHNPALRDKAFDLMTNTGIHWSRNYGSDGIVYSWRFVEPANNAFNWTVWDILVQQAQENNVGLLASIGNAVPSWANGSATFQDPPLDLWDEPIQSTWFYNYVYTVVERYDGDGLNDMPGLVRPIKYWELWNEPDLLSAFEKDFPPHQFNGDVNEYVRMTRIGYTAVHAADPEAIVVGPATAQPAEYGGDVCWESTAAAAGASMDAYNQATMSAAFEVEPASPDVVRCYLAWTWIDWYEAGGLDYVDEISFNRYWGSDSDWWDGEILLTNPNRTYVDYVLDEADKARHGRLVWLTETGVMGNPTTTYLDKARNYVRMSTVFWQRPYLTKFVWFNLQSSADYEGSNNQALFQTPNSDVGDGIVSDPLFHPLYRSIDVMNELLAGFTTSDRPVLVTKTDTVRVYKFSAQGRQVWLFWSRNGQNINVNINTSGQNTRVVGLFGERQPAGYPELFSGGSIMAGLRPIYLTTDLNWTGNVSIITGRVSNSTQPNDHTNGMSNVTVNLTGPVNASTSTDAEGNYYFHGLPEGDYTVSLPDYVSNPEGQQVNLDSEGAFGQTSFEIP